MQRAKDWFFRGTVAKWSKAPVRKANKPKLKFNLGNRLKGFVFKNYYGACESAGIEQMS